MRVHTLALLALVLAGGEVMADESFAAEQARPTTRLDGWSDFVAELEPLGERMMAQLPAPLRDDPQIQQEASRLLLMATARMAIDGIIGDRSNPMFVPEINVALNLYQPNADTVYRSALIEPGGSYRLRGKRGSVLYFILGELGPDMIRTGTPSPARAYHDFDELTLDSDGRFDVILSPERPAGHTGDWWRLDPRTEKLMIRQVAYDWSDETDPSIAIERLDTPTGRPRLTAAELQARLAELPSMIGNAATFFVAHVEGLRQQGYLNKLKTVDMQNMTGLTGQSYYEGAYAIADDEALLVEVKVPEHCRYWSLILTSELYETVDWYNNHSSLNGAQARVDDDGYFRAVVSARDPGIPNWLDTAGYRKGAMQGRWLGCDGPMPVPSLRSLPFAEVRQHLPADTPVVTAEQRAAVLAARRAAVQQRPLW